MPDLWLPPGTKEKAADERRRVAEAYAQQAGAFHLFKEWNARLREIDPNLQLVKASDDATLPGLRPSYWHVLKHNPGGVPGIVVHEGPDGEYMEPNSYLFKRLEEGDLWDDRVVRDREKRRKKIAQAAERQREREREDRITEMQERLRSRSGTQVLIR